MEGVEVQGVQNEESQLLEENTEQIQNMNNDNLAELQELKALNVWGERQEVLEQQALKELEIFTEDNKSGNAPEEGELLNDDSEKCQVPEGSSTLNVDDYIKRQQELKKRQDHKRSMQVSKRSKIVAEQISKKHNQNVTLKIFKRSSSSVQNDRNPKKVKRKESSSSNKSEEDGSGSEYVPSEEDHCSDHEGQGKRIKADRVRNPNMEKVKDDGCEDLYKARLNAYYKAIEDQNENLEQEDDIELLGGLRVPAKMWNNLYSYQQEGIEWLWNIHRQFSGALLGDEMGLGKTVQVIVFLAALDHTRNLPNTRSGGLGPTLIVSPATVVHQWVKHFHEWAPEFRVAVLHQSGSFTGNRTQLIRDINKTRSILVTTYSGILKYKGVLAEQNWQYLILDEGHKIRNPGAKISIAVKQFRTPKRIMLTGSPMQNNLQELWSIFDFVVPGVLGTQATFLEHFANPIIQGGFANATPMQEATALSVASALKAVISPYLLRRSKNEVKEDISLPSKSEQVLFCSLSDEQRDLYKGYLMSDDVNTILGRGTKNWFSENHMRANVLVAITTLRKICNHPNLYLEESELDSLDPEQSKSDNQSFYKRSGKMIVVSALLKLWKKQNHRVLLFTQSRAMMILFERFLEQQGYKFLKMDGSTNISFRQPLIDKFNQDASYDVFLLTTRVGGLGINLTGANRVIIYDPDWNPATDTQARERAWRIGQEKQVTVYRLISAGTIEEKMYQRQVWKQLLSNKVLLDPKTQKFFKTSDLHDLFSLPERDEISNPETANIFRNSRVNLQEKIDQKRHSKTDKLKTTKSDSAFQFSDEKIQEMKDLAQKIAKSMSSTPTNKPEESQTTYQKELDEERTQKLQDRESLKKLSPLELRAFNRSKLEKQEAPPINKIDGYDTSVSFTAALEISEKTAKFYHDVKSHKIKLDSDNNGSSSAPSVVSSDSKNEDGTQNAQNDTEHKQKHSKKKDKTVKIDDSGMLDGEVIEGLLKREIKKKEKRKHKHDGNSNEDQDNYILEKLMSKKGVHTALQHDVIVQSGYKDNNIKIHYEAQKRTDSALQALRKSRLEKWKW